MWFSCICIYIYIFFFQILFHDKVLNRVPCVIQQILVVYLLYIQ